MPYDWEEPMTHRERVYKETPLEVSYLQFYCYFTPLKVLQLTISSLTRAIYREGAGG